MRIPPAKRCHMRPAARALVVVSVLLILAACGTTGQGTSGPAPSQAPSGPIGESPTTVPEATPGETGSPSDSPAPTTPSEPPSQAIAVDSVVRTISTGLRLREDPTTRAASLGTLAEGSQSYVVDGPVAADGYSWYLLSGLGIPQYSGCAGPMRSDPWECPVWFGWVASASTDGDPWLTTDAPDCPAWPEVVTHGITLGVPRITYLACFGGQERTLTGFYPLIPDDAGLGGACGGVPEELSWIACNLGYEHIGTAETDQFGTGFVFSVDPSVGVPDRGQWIRLTGRFDHAAAQECAFGAEPERSLLQCRAEFVVDAAEAVSAP